MALFSYPVCTWLCQYVNMGVRKWLEKSAEKQKYKLRKTLNPLSRKAFRAVSFSATKDKKPPFSHENGGFSFSLLYITKIESEKITFTSDHRNTTDGFLV